MNSFASTTMKEQVDRVNNGLLHDVKIAPTKDYENIKDPVLFHNASEGALKIQLPAATSAALAADFFFG